MWLKSKQLALLLFPEIISNKWQNGHLAQLLPALPSPPSAFIQTVVFIYYQKYSGVVGLRSETQGVCWRSRRTPTCVEICADASMLTTFATQLH